MSGGGGGLKSAEKMSRIIWMAPNIDTHGLKIQGEGPWGFYRILGGGYIKGLWKCWVEGTLISGFIAFLLTSFVKFWREGPLLYPLPPLPPVCIFGQCRNLKHKSKTTKSSKFSLQNCYASEIFVLYFYKWHLSFRHLDNEW